LITRFDIEKFKTKFTCEVKGYDSDNYFDRKEANKLDMYSQFVHIASNEAIKDSGVNLEKIDTEGRIILAKQESSLKTGLKQPLYNTTRN
jgi:3-oxoacyl-(acyl-carrier-protein) synthase